MEILVGIHDVFYFKKAIHILWFCLLTSLETMTNAAAMSTQRTQILVPKYYSSLIGIRTCNPFSNQVSKKLPNTKYKTIGALMRVIMQRIETYQLYLVSGWCLEDISEPTHVLAIKKKHSSVYRVFPRSQAIIVKVVNVI